MLSRIVDLFLDFYFDLEFELKWSLIVSERTSRCWRGRVFFNIAWDFSIMLSMLFIDIFSSSMVFSVSLVWALDLNIIILIAGMIIFY